MSRFARSAALALALGCVTAAAAQTSGVPVETAPVPLPLDKQTIVKDYVKRSDMPAVDPGAPVAVGMTVPEGTELFALPQDNVTEVPSVTRYKFLVTGATIAVVDPETRKVIQIIQR